jgi:hypothetical protein
MWLDATRGKGLQVEGNLDMLHIITINLNEGRWVRRTGKIFAEMNFSNKALQPLSQFAIQFNSNSFVILLCFHFP